MIASFGDRATEDLYHGRKSKAARRVPTDIVFVALRKLNMINAAQVLQDLASPLGNHVESLRGNLRGTTASASTTSGGLCSAGQRVRHTGCA